MSDNASKEVTRLTNFAASVQQYAFAGSSPASPARHMTRSSSSTTSQSPYVGAVSRMSKTKVTAPKAISSSPVSPSIQHSKKKRKRESSSYAPPSKYAHLTNHLVDSLAPNLICLFVGVNPGLRTATTGHAYAHPSNLFWKLCYSSGCTPRLCLPSEDRALPSLYSLGHTNIVTRPTKDASELQKSEYDAGVPILEAKIRYWKPESVCIVGKGIWESIWRVKHGRAIKKEEFAYGWQADAERMGIGVSEAQGPSSQGTWAGSRVFVATTTSGLAAGMRPWEKEEVWKGLGEWVAKRRMEKGIPDEGGVPGFVEAFVKNEAAVQDDIKEEAEELVKNAVSEKGDGAITEEAERLIKEDEEDDAKIKKEATTSIAGTA